MRDLFRMELTRIPRTLVVASQSDPAAFATQYGAKPNAFGKCVSKLAKQIRSS